MSKKESKIIGILGGMGPYATVDFFKKILDATPAKKDWEHLRIIIDNNPKIPSRTRAVIFNDNDPLPALIKTAQNLEKAGADFIVIPCNSAHYYYDKIQTEVKIPVVNMITETVKCVMDSMPSINKVTLLSGLVPIKTKLYERRFHKFKVEVIVPGVRDQKDVCRVIEDIKLDRGAKSTKARLKKVSDRLATKRSQAIIFGCTELGILFSKDDFIIPIFDSTEILAKEVVRRAL